MSRLHHGGHDAESLHYHFWSTIRDFPLAWLFPFWFTP